MNRRLMLIGLLAVIGASQGMTVFPCEHWATARPAEFGGLTQACEETAATASAEGEPPAPARVSGALKKWQPVTLDFNGPQLSAGDSDPNPFLDFRLNVVFTGPSGQQITVPGFFAGDGAGGLKGNVWRACLGPDKVGTWSYEASFRTGPEVAISLDRNAGSPVDFDGAQGMFEVGERPRGAPRFYVWGRLEYAGGHYLKFRDGSYWLKGGTDSPEDFLGYLGFANTEPGKFGGHRYENHIQDWNDGDPDWGNGAGRGIVGTLNYLASQQVNSLYLLTMNIGGDGRNVHPYLGNPKLTGSPDNDNLHFDLTKLHQWGLVLEHAQRKGIFLHFVLNEAEEPNKRELDDGELGVERKLYYRELIARFGHHPALQWNLCEEYNHKFNFGPERIKAFAQYIQGVDPYDHPITVHHSSTLNRNWTPFLGDVRFTVGSFQVKKVDRVEVWRKKSADAGVPLVIGMDEYFPDKTSPENMVRHRKEYLWPIYFSGGHVEFILDELLRTDDFRVYEPLWQSMGMARSFMEMLPVWNMEPADHLLSGSSVFEGKHNRLSGQVLARPGKAYAIYFPRAEETGTLDLTGDSGEFELRWANPRHREFVGDAIPVSGGAPVELGPVPEDSDEDWVALLTIKQVE